MRVLATLLVFGLSVHHAAAQTLNYASAASHSAEADPNPTRLIMGPTARALEQGKLYVDFSAMIGGPFLQVGLTDRVSLGYGTPVLIPGIHPGSVFVITPKVNVFSGAKTDAAVGLLHFSSMHAEYNGMAYAVVTHGTPDAAVTAGVGVSYASRDYLHTSRARVVMLGGEKRVSRRFKLIAESYVSGNSGIVNGGFRILRKHRSVDLGAVTFLGGPTPIVAPMFRFTWAL